MKIKDPQYCYKQLRDKKLNIKNVVFSYRLLPAMKPECYEILVEMLSKLKWKVNEETFFTVSRILHLHLRYKIETEHVKKLLQEIRIWAANCMVWNLVQRRS